MTQRICIKTPAVTPGFINASYSPSHTGWWAIPDEWSDDDEPAFVLLFRQLASSQSAMFEWLRNRPVNGNTEQTILGHTHPKHDVFALNDSVPVSRNGIVCLPRFPWQSTTSTSAQTATFEIYNTGYPNESMESAGTSITNETPEFYMVTHYETFSYMIRMKVTSGATGWAKLELLDADGDSWSPTIDDTVTTSSTTFVDKIFSLTIPEDLPSGWWRLKLTYCIVSGAGTVTIGSAGDETDSTDLCVNGWLS